MLACQSDQRLVALFRAGHDAAFEAIVRRYRRALLAYTRRLLGDGRAEDAVQQALLNAYRAIPSSEAELELRPWLYRVVHNATLDILRHGGPETVALTDDREGVDRPDEVFERRERARELIAALQNLPRRQRDALVLRELEGRGHEEIATRLGVTGGAVRQLIHRARSGVRAGVSAVMPWGLVESLARGSAGETLAGRLPELVAAGATTTTLAKAGVAIVVVGGMAGGGAAVTGPDAESRADRGAGLSAPPAAASTPQPPADLDGPATSARTPGAPSRANAGRKARARADARPGRTQRGAGATDAPRQPQLLQRAAQPGAGVTRPVASRQEQERDVDAPEPAEVEEAEEVEEVKEVEEVERPDAAEPVEVEAPEAPEPDEADDNDAPDDEIDD